MKTKKIVVMMLGARMHYAVPIILNRNGWLDQFFTDYYRKTSSRTFLEWTIEKILLLNKGRLGLLSRMSSRRSEHLCDKSITSFPLLSILYVITLKLFKSHYLSRIAFCIFGSIFARLVAKKLRDEGVILYGYDCASLEAFSVNKKNGGINIYEQTILPYSLEHSLLKSEYEKHKNFSNTKVGKFHKNSARRLKAEWDLSDRIIVGSAFVKEGMVSLGVDPNKIEVIPYGVSLPKPENKERMFYKTTQNKPIKLLFVGEVGLRKGVISLIEALKSIESTHDFRIDFVGRVAISQSYLNSLSERFSFHGKVNREAVAEFYRNADLFILPSIVEGSATVTYEAMSFGLPVMTSTSSGSLVRDAVDGYVLQDTNVQCIRKAIVEVIENDNILEGFRKNIKNSEFNVSVDRYERDISKLIRAVQHSKIMMS